MTREILVEVAGDRLDRFVADKIDESRERVSGLIKDGNILVNGQVKKVSYKVSEGDLISVTIPEPLSLDIEEEKIKLDIIYEDDDIAAINKPKGMIVHPSGNIVTGTLVNALLYHFDKLSEINGVYRPGIVHRLDKDTSGLLLVAKNSKAHISLQDQFKDRTVKKEYIALVNGGFKEDKGEVNLPIARDKRNRKRMAVDPGGRYALTRYEVIERFGKYTLLRVNILTGRTHQIRVHMTHIKHPLVGDIQYSRGKNEFGIEGQLLHSRMLEFAHPITGQRMKLEAELPEEFKEVLRKLGSEYENI